MQFSYRIAGLRLRTVPPLAALAAFAAHDETPSAALAPPQSAPAAEDSGGWTATAHGLLAGEVVPLGLVLGRRGLTLRVPGGGEIRVQRGGEALRLVAESDPPAIHEQALLGPGLCLALAMRGVICLHASAAEREGSVCLFLGESGAGKSTLARALDRSPGWRRIADDCLPVVLASRVGDRRSLLARPRFPQLKLDPAQQWSPQAPGELEVRRVYRLVDGVAGCERPIVESLTGRQGALLLVRHTAAARLFPPKLLAWHLSWTVEVAETVPVSRLAFPRRLDLLPAVVERIEEDLELAGESSEAPGSRLCNGAPT